MESFEMLSASADFGEQNKGWTGPQSFDFLDDNLRNVSLIGIQIKVMWKKQHLKNMFLFSGFSWTFFLATCGLEERFLLIVCMW